MSNFRSWTSLAARGSPSVCLFKDKRLSGHVDLLRLIASCEPSLCHRAVARIVRPPGAMSAGGRREFEAQNLLDFAKGHPSFAGRQPIQEPLERLEFGHQVPPHMYYIFTVPIEELSNVLSLHRRDDELRALLHARRPARGHRLCLRVEADRVRAVLV